MRACVITGCESTPKKIRKGMCSKHYQRVKGTGSPHLAEPVPMEVRFWAKVDKSGECWEWKGSKTPMGYPRFGGKGYAHRIAWSMVNGAIPEKGEIDHICHNPGCVNPEHLRLATRKQNIENHSGPKKNSKTGIRGVFATNSATPWTARVRHNGIVHFLGSFHDIRDAEAAVIAKRNELHAFNDLDRIEGQP